MSFLYSIGHCLPCQIISHRKAAILPPFQMGQKHFMLSLYRLGRQIPVQGDLSGELRTILSLHGTTAPLTAVPDGHSSPPEQPPSEYSRSGPSRRRFLSLHQRFHTSPTADPSSFNQQFHDKQEIPDYNNPMFLRSVGSDSPLIPVLRQAARSI